MIALIARLTGLSRVLNKVMMRMPGLKSARLMKLRWGKRKLMSGYELRILMFLGMSIWLNKTLRVCPFSSDKRWYNRILGLFTYSAKLKPLKEIKIFVAPSIFCTTSSLKNVSQEMRLDAWRQNSYRYISNMALFKTGSINFKAIIKKYLLSIQ